MVQLKKSVLVGMPVLLSGAGTERQVLSLVHALLDAGCRITLCCYYEFEQSVVELFEDAGVRIILLKLKRSHSEFRLCEAMGLIKALLRVYRLVMPNIAHIQYLAPGMLPILAARLAGIKTVLSTVHIAGKAAYGLKAKLMLRFAALFCTCFFCVSRGVEDFWFGDSLVFEPNNILKGRRHYTIYNAIDVAHIKTIVAGANRESLRKRLCLGRAQVIGIVGRLVEQKGHCFLLNAMTQVLVRCPDTVLLVGGNGPKKEDLMRTAERLALSQHIRWLGVLPQDEVLELYTVMDVLAMPSLYEGFGLAVAEAMAAGLPVVASAVEGLTEVVEDGLTGYLVPPGDGKAMAGRLLELLSDPEKAQAMGEAGRQRVLGHFSMERFASSTLAVYRHFS
jgi:L-malate glycosyltransferase